MHAIRHLTGESLENPQRPAQLTCGHGHGWRGEMNPHHIRTKFLVTLRLENGGHVRARPTNIP